MRESSQDICSWYITTTVSDGRWSIHGRHAAESLLYINIFWVLWFVVHQDPEFTGRRVATFHCQRDYLFVRHHRCISLKRTRIPSQTLYAAIRDLHTAYFLLDVMLRTECLAGTYFRRSVEGQKRAFRRSGRALHWSSKACRPEHLTVAEVNMSGLIWLRMTKRSENLPSNMVNSFMDFFIH